MKNSEDRGAILPIVLVIVLILSVSLVAIAGYVSADLRYGKVTVARADRLAAADGAMNYAIDQLKLRNASCLLGGGGTLPGLSSPINGATTTVTCSRTDVGLGDVQGWAAVITGVGVPTSGVLLSSQSGNSAPKILDGPVFMQRAKAVNFSLGPDVKIANGPLYYNDPNCGTLSASPATPPSNLIFVPALIFGPTCTLQDWTNVAPDPAVPDLSILAVNPPPTMNGACQVFSPGMYDTLPNLGNNVYLMSGDYYLKNLAFDIKNSVITAGHRDPAIAPTQEVPNAPCDAVQAADPGKGATFYLGGSSHIQVVSNGALEVMPRLQGTNYISIQALCAVAGCDQTGNVNNPSTVGVAATDPVVFTKPGNGKQLVTHGLLYTPTGRLEFGDVSNSADQKILGGLVVAKLVLQSSASATNFEIATIVSPVDAVMVITATATKNGTTTIRAVVDYRPSEDDLDARLAISSWRVVN